MVEGVDFKAIGVATPAVLTAEMAEGCSDYVTSVVLMVRLYVCVCMRGYVCVHMCVYTCVCPSHALATTHVLVLSPNARARALPARRGAAVQHPQRVRDEARDGRHKVGGHTGGAHQGLVGGTFGDV